MNAMHDYPPCLTFSARSERLVVGRCVSGSEPRARARCCRAPPSQVAASLEAAEPFKEDLVKRGVLVVPLPLFGEARSLLCRQSGGGGSQAGGQAGVCLLFPSIAPDSRHSCKCRPCRPPPPGRRGTGRASRDLSSACLARALPTGADHATFDV